MLTYRKFVGAVMVLVVVSQVVMLIHHMILFMIIIKLIMEVRIVHIIITINSCC